MHNILLCITELHDIVYMKHVKINIVIYYIKKILLFRVYRICKPYDNNILLVVLQKR